VQSATFELYFGGLARRSGRPRIFVILRERDAARLLPALVCEQGNCF